MPKEIDPHFPPLPCSFCGRSYFTVEWLWWSYDHRSARICDTCIAGAVAWRAKAVREGDGTRLVALKEQSK